MHTTQQTPASSPSSFLSSPHSTTSSPHPPPTSKRQDAVYTPDRICDLMAASDYVVAATPWTPETDKIVSKGAIAAMRPNGVFVNVGRGKCVDEEALIEGKRGA